ncbi:MAG: hypothetical protein H7Z75_10855 [Ferruginibacter sp.]|nr:hypothetical protein [Cytophagales bacterium]
MRKILTFALLGLLFAGARTQMASQPAGSNARGTTPWPGNQRLGLHVTASELAVWQQRAKAGPYQRPGDAQPNSPGDWERISANAREFLRQPGADRYAGYPGPGCVPKGAEYDPARNGNRLRDAAFVFLLTGDTAYRNAVRTELLAQAAEPLTDFSDTTRWCFLGDANPGFIITEWLTRLLFAYDYTKDAYSPQQRARLDRWFLDAACYFGRGIERSYSRSFVNRPGGDYALTSYTRGAQERDPKEFMYYGSPAVGFFARSYNNRNATIARFVGTAGVFLENESLKKIAKQWFFEWLRYGVYPGGDVADLHRGTANPREPERGLNYAFSTAQAMADLADVLARCGDNSLYEYQTSAGYFGTEGQPKSLLRVMKNTADYLNGQHVRYATTEATHAGDPNFLIDGRDPFLPHSNVIVYDTWFALPNLYYRDAGIQANYRRQAPGTRPYPAYPRSAGPNPAWSGVGSIYPGILFMFGQLEGIVQPYPNYPAPPTGAKKRQ